jgi:hypothetical protein
MDIGCLAKRFGHFIVVLTNGEYDYFKTLSWQVLHTTKIQPADRVFPEVSGKKTDTKAPTGLVNASAIAKINATVDAPEIGMKIAVVIALVGSEEVRGHKSVRRINGDSIIDQLLHTVDQAIATLS